MIYRKYFSAFRVKGYKLTIYCSSYVAKCFLVTSVKLLPAIFRCIRSHLVWKQLSLRLSGWKKRSRSHTSWLVVEAGNNLKLTFIPGANKTSQSSAIACCSYCQRNARVTFKDFRRWMAALSEGCRGDADPVLVRRRPNVEPWRDEFGCFLQESYCFMSQFKLRIQRF